MRILTNPSRPFFISIIAALFAVVLWAGAPLLVDIASSVPPFQLTAIALISGAIVALPVSLRKRRHRGGQPVQAPVSLKWRLAIYGLLPALILGAIGGYLTGVGMAPTAEAALITYTWPVMFIVISQWLFHRRLPLPVLCGALIAFSGAAVLLSPETESVGHSQYLAGYALALMAGCCWALYSWICQAAPVAIAPMMPGLFLLAAFGAAIADVLSGSPFGLPSGLALVAGVALGVGPYGLAMMAWDLALRTGPTALVGSLAYGVPVLAATFLVIAGVAAPDWRLPLAALLVVAGSVVATMKRGNGALKY
ncbi:MULTISPECIES: DMT family transporter [unclassified Marinobacter]|uniref:DMT family transporter n=1 Tax=unclassified Marinobacter TaxID=83889 RepID=UPI0026E3364F|nr:MULTISPECIES: DMT family transporter [unclassified Marinobacter]MDO6440729.1 DMT family transporter [Marinobacter sp. 2_MG-2023]MDO6823556.1 DMT family transporter [Marinobacter sp. 1_MG-2023]